MSNTQWTDDFLNDKRRKGDIWYDDDVKVVLSPSFLDDQKGVFAAWVKSQSDVIAEGRQIADAPTEEHALPLATIQKIDQLVDLQIRQYTELEAWAAHMWPREFLFHIDSARLATVIACKALIHRRVEVALSAMNCALANAALLDKRYDQLAAQVAAQPGLKQQIVADNLAAYSRFLKISNAICNAPGMFLCDHGFRKTQFKSYPESFTDNFTPMWCPEWVDEEKLRAGVSLWQEHMVGCLLVLFVRSLPACYLDKKGIPMLYRTERLGKQEFLAQRLYETGFMLNDVMEQDGLSILSDTGAMDTAWFAVAVHRVHPDWKFQLGRFLRPEWTDARGNTHTYAELLADPTIRQEYRALEQQHAMPETYTASDLGCPSFEWLFRDCLEASPNPTFNCFRGRTLWGHGFLAATRVRYLHASMRYRVLQDHPPYDVQENGMPINQEDLAYTLLTFGYVIPVGIEKLGGILNRAEKEAFLHCWKVVGFIMGIDDDLLTDDWDQAKELFDKIKSRQQAPSANAVALTNALCTFMTDLLPAWLPFRSAIVPVLIRDQMGADADDLFDVQSKAASRNLVVRGCWAFVKHVLLRGYFLSRHFFFDRILPVRVATAGEVQFMGMAVVKSWRQTFERQPLDLTAHEQGFTVNSEVTAAEHEKRAAIRRKVLQGAAVGVGLILLFHPFFWLGVASLVAWYFSSAPWAGWVVQAMFWLLVIDQIALGLVERRLQTLLQEQALHSQSYL